MSITITGQFSNSKKAGDAVSELKTKGYTKDIYVVTKNEKQSIPIVKGIKKDISDDAIASAVAGGGLGLVVGILAGVMPSADPTTSGMIVFGPLTALFGMIGGATGAILGGVFGALSSIIVSDVSKKINGEKVEKGDTHVGVTTNPETIKEVKNVLIDHGVERVKQSSFA